MRGKGGAEAAATSVRLGGGAAKSRYDWTAIKGEEQWAGWRRARQPQARSAVTQRPPATPMRLQWAAGASLAQRATPAAGGERLQPVASQLRVLDCVPRLSELSLAAGRLSCLAGRLASGWAGGQA